MVENCNGGIKKTSKDLVVSGIICKFAAKIYNDSLLSRLEIIVVKKARI